MNKLLYYIILLMGLVCVALSITLIIASNTNQKIQLKIQNQQQYLNSGILGQQGQQIAGSIIQEMDKVAVSNSNIRFILEQYGFRKPASSPTEPLESGASKQ